MSEGNRTPDLRNHNPAKGRRRLHGEAWNGPHEPQCAHGDTSRPPSLVRLRLKSAKIRAKIFYRTLRLTSTLRAFPSLHMECPASARQPPFSFNPWTTCQRM